MTATSTQSAALLKDHADLIAAHDKITGTDQSSVATRAGKVRQINSVELALYRTKTPFEHWTSPASNRVKKVGGQTDAELMADITELTEVVGDANAPETIRTTADQLRTRKVKIAQERGLMTEDGEVAEPETAETAETA